MQVVGIDVWNGSVNGVTTYASRGGRSVTYPIGMQGASYGSVWGLDRSSMAIVDRDGKVAYFTPQSTSYTRRYRDHKAEMMAKLDELTTATSVAENSGPTPSGFSLAANSPNPFAGLTTIRFSVPTARAAAPVQVGVYDLLGREVQTLADGVFPPGTHSLQWNGSRAGGGRAPAGVYFYVFRSGDTRLIRRMVLLPR